MHVAAREIKAQGRAHEASGEARCTHCFLRLRHTVSPLVYSKTDHSFYSTLIYRTPRSKKCWEQIILSLIRLGIYGLGCNVKALIVWDTLHLCWYSESSFDIGLHAESLCLFRTNCDQVRKHTIESCWQANTQIQAAVLLK